MTRPPYRVFAALFAIVAVLLIMSGCGRSAADGGAGNNRGDPPVLVFAAMPTLRFATAQQSQEPVIEMLKKETGKEVRFQTGTDYAAIIKGLRDGKFDVADLGPLSYVLAKEQGAPITVVASRVNEKGKPPGYQSYGITWTGSPIKTLADFRGKRICFVDRNSTSGYLYPSGLCSLWVSTRTKTSYQSSLVVTTPRSSRWLTTSATPVSRTTPWSTSS